MKMTKYEWPGRGKPLPPMPKKRQPREPEQGMTLAQRAETERLVLMRGWTPKMVGEYLGVTENAAADHCRRNNIKRPISIQKRKRGTITEVWACIQAGDRPAEAARALGVDPCIIGKDYKLLRQMPPEKRQLCFDFEYDTAWMELRERGLPRKH
jgi:hypothetical protein